MSLSEYGEALAENEDLKRQLAARDRTIAELKAKIEDQEWLEISRENLLKISKRQQVTLAEQAEALEGYRSTADAIPDCAIGPTENGIISVDRLVEFVLKHLPAHEIAALRERGVEVGDDKQEHNP